ncbi:DinB family protein [Edaphobacter aggregans]|uniref:DinB family protein n=1 Tax=Edaphobacter aggregans TaxID=570835 RepID=UPI0005570F49|nr:DinB family protein [Edaphobacter aggregans]
MDPTLHHLATRLSSALHGLDASQTQLRLTPDPSCWTIQQIIEHLLLTYASTGASFETRLAKGTPTLSRPTSAQRTAQFIVVTLGLMPGRRKSPPEVAPAASAVPLSGSELIAITHAALTRLDHIFDQAEQAFGSTRCLSHFILGPLSASQWRRFHLSHGNHHVRQIAAIRRTHGL